MTVELDGTTTGRRGRSTVVARGDAGDALVQPRGEEEGWWMRILAEADGKPPAMEVVGGNEEGSGSVQGVHGREREPKE